VGLCHRLGPVLIDMGYFHISSTSTDRVPGGLQSVTGMSCSHKMLSGEQQGQLRAGVHWTGTSFSPSENNVLGNDHSCSHACLKPLAACYCAAGEKWKPTSLITLKLKLYMCYVQHFVILAVKKYERVFKGLSLETCLAGAINIETYNTLSHDKLHIFDVELHNLYDITSMSSLPQLDTFHNVDTVLSSHWLARYSSL